MSSWPLVQECCEVASRRGPWIQVQELCNSPSQRERGVECGTEGVGATEGQRGGL